MTVWQKVFTPVKTGVNPTNGGNEFRLSSEGQNGLLANG
jgi:hypothetical protein